nr:alpha-crystallin chain A - Amazon manatee (fragments) [Trichechus inunguis]
ALGPVLDLPSAVQSGEEKASS